MSRIRSLSILPSVFFLALTGCASMSAPITNAPRETAAITAVCTKIMHLSKSEAGFESCRDSLADSLASSLEGERTFLDHQACVHQGLKPDSPELATCVLDRSNAQRAGDGYSTVADLQQIDRVASTDTSQASYYGVAPRENYRREQYSCAQLGFAPGSAQFSQCVGDLDAAMFAATHSPT